MHGSNFLYFIVAGMLFTLGSCSRTAYRMQSSSNISIAVDGNQVDFSHLPDNFVQRIIETLSPKERYKMRLVSRRIKTLTNPLLKEWFTYYVFDDEFQPFGSEKPFQLMRSGDPDLRSRIDFARAHRISHIACKGDTELTYLNTLCDNLQDHSWKSLYLALRETSLSGGALIQFLGENLEHLDIQVLDLDLSHMTIGDADVHHFAKLKNIRCLNMHINGGGFSNEGAEALAEELGNLEFLNVSWGCFFVLSRKKVANV